MITLPEPPIDYYSCVVGGFDLDQSAKCGRVVGIMSRVFVIKNTVFFLDNLGRSVWVAHFLSGKATIEGVPRRAVGLTRLQSLS
jgi:hypothetical protein